MVQHRHINRVTHWDHVEIIFIVFLKDLKATHCLMFNTNANFHKQWHNDLPNNLKTTFYKLLNSSLIAVVAHVDFTCTSAGKVCTGPARHTGQPDLLWFLTALQADNAEFFLFLTFIFIFFCALLSFPLYIDKRCFVLLHWRIKFFLQSLILIFCCGLLSFLFCENLSLWSRMPSPALPQGNSWLVCL